MEDVARQAGVSLGTVSHALNHPHRVAPATLERVRLAIEELGFVPDRQARTLAGGTSSVIGLVVIDLANSYFVDIARGAEDEATEAGFHVVLGNADLQVDKERAYLRLFRETRAAGVLLTPHSRSFHLDEPDPDWPRSLVVVNTETGPGRCSVVPDDELGGYLATRHLIDTGRRRLAFAAGLLHLAPVARRLVGARRAVAETGGAVTLEVVETEGLRPHHGTDIARRILDRAPSERPDGVFAAADLVALGIVQALIGHADLRVPDDLAVVGYDDNKEAWASAVPLTTIAQPGYDVGRRSAGLLLEEIRTPGEHVHQQLLIAPKLVVRDSAPNGRRAG